MKKIVIITLFTVILLSAKAQKFEFNHLQSGSITFVELFTEELEGLGKVEPIPSQVEFVLNHKKLKVVGKTIKGDVLFEFGTDMGNIFNYNVSEQAMYIQVGKAEDIKDGVADGIAEFEVIPKEKKFDVFIPPMENSEVEHHELIRFVIKDSGNQEQANKNAYDELLRRFQNAGFKEDYWY